MATIEHEIAIQNVGAIPELVIRLPAGGDDWCGQFSVIPGDPLLAGADGTPPR